MNLPYDRIYRKTERGVAALNTRSGELPARGRTALILVNGRDSLRGLVGKIGADAVVLIEMLLGLGFVEEVVQEQPVVRAKPPAPPVATGPAAAQEPPTSRPAPPPDPAAAAATLARLLPLKREAVNRLAPQFGPDVDGVCRPLLVSATIDDYNEALKAIETKLSIYLGRKAAQRLLDDLRP